MSLPFELNGLVLLVGGRERAGLRDFARSGSRRCGEQRSMARPPMAPEEDISMGSWLVVVAEDGAVQERFASLSCSLNSIGGMIERFWLR